MLLTYELAKTPVHKHVFVSPVEVSEIYVIY